MSSVCRACLTGDVKMYFLKNYFMEIYEKLTNSKLSARGPQAVCYICHSLLQRCHRFAEMARCSESTLQDLLDTGIEVSHENIVKLNPTIESTLSVASMQIMGLDNIIKRVDSPHVKEEFVTSEEEFVVNEEFTVEKLVAAAGDFSVLVNQPMEYLTESVLSESTETSSHGDKSVDRCCYTPQNIHGLVIDKDKKKIVCNQCSKKFSMKQKLTAHIQTHNQVTFACDICNQKFTSKYFIKKHKLDTHKKEWPYSCALCDKIFYRKSTLTTHMRIHTGEKPYACNVCDKKLSNNTHLNRHLRTHTAERPYACDVCDKKFSGKTNLIRHLRTHTGVRPFACNVCGIKFSLKHHLIGHLRTHTGERPYACNVCDKKFSYKYCLIRHLTHHTGERPYACDVCDKKFSQKSNLIQHLRTHTGERQYACNVCDKKFSYKTCFIRHLTHHTGERP